MPPPQEPVFISLAAGLQQEPIHGAPPRVPRYVPTAPRQGEQTAVREAARLLVAAERPVIVADRAARTANGMKLLVELAELLQAPVVDQAGRMNFPTTHHLNHTQRAGAVVGQADVLIGLELTDFWNTVNAYIDNGENLREPRIKSGANLISIGAGDFYLKSNYQDFQRLQAVDVSIAGDAARTLPPLIEAVRPALSSERQDPLA